MWWWVLPTSVANKTRHLRPACVVHKMTFTGAYLTIIYTVLLHFTIAGTNSWIFNILDVEAKLFILPFQGLVFITYPLIGLLADNKLTRYQMIRLSCWILFVCNGIFSILSILVSIDTIDYENITLNVGVMLIIALAIVGKGMFESTVIQFGTDQMIEASSNQLSTFIHWYYWSLYIGNVCIDTIINGILIYLSHCQIDSNFPRDVAVIKSVILPLCIPQCCLCCITLLLLYLKKFKNYLNIEPVGVNPVKQIIDVLKYAYHHKYPVRRSALSYYQNTYPSRIDFGKIQYGGPFTNEQVEDTKTVLRLLVLLASLFGFHLSSDGFSTANHTLRKTCPSSLILLYFISNPSFISNFITLFGIPLFHLLRKFSFTKYFPNMKKRMWIGILFSFLHELVSLIISNHIEHTTACEFDDNQSKRVSLSSTQICYFSLIHFANNTKWNTTDCVSYCSSSIFTSDNTLMWFLVPQILHGFGYMLVFLTVLEFICAQAPFRLKGFMVGIWYAMLSIKYFITTIDTVIFYYLMEKTSIIYESIKIGIIGLSLIIFGISCRWYRYRERDEIVNVQGMIEEIYERELLQQENEENNSDDDTNTVLISSQTDYQTFQK